jgi:hypothetical protein
LDFLATLVLNMSLSVEYKEQDQSPLEENGSALTEEDVQFVKRLSQSLVATLVPGGKGDAETIQAVRQRIVEWQQRD